MTREEEYKWEQVNKQFYHNQGFYENPIGITYTKLFSKALVWACGGRVIYTGGVN